MNTTMRSGLVAQVAFISGQALKSPSVSRQHSRLLSTSRKLSSVHTNPAISETDTRKWDLYVGLCLERRPVITKDLTPLETKYAAFLAQYEVELSHKSDHEIRHETDKKLLEQIKKGEVEQANVQTAQDFEDLCAKELEEFKAASRVTEADKTNNIKSLDRALQSHLLLAVQQKVGKEYKWSVPYMKLSGQESLRQVAEDALILFCPDVKARVIGNAPWGVYKYNYPTKIRDESGAFGSKVFFYKAQLLSGQMTMPKDKAVASTIKDFAWLTRAELPEYFFKDYFHNLSDLLIPEY